MDFEILGLGLMKGTDRVNAGAGLQVFRIIGIPKPIVQFP